MRETIQTANFTFWVTLAVIVAMLVGGGLWLLTRPAQLNIEREAIQHSNPYIQSKIMQLVDLKAQYARLDAQAEQYANNKSVVSSLRAQQKAITEQMWEAYSLIPIEVHNNVPQTIRNFLNEHPLGR